jgi:hypothetical protein
MMKNREPWRTALSIRPIWKKLKSLIEEGNVYIIS